MGPGCEDLARARWEGQEDSDRPFWRPRGPEEGRQDGSIWEMDFEG